VRGDGCLRIAGDAGEMSAMHLVPPERAHRKAIDEHTVCDAIQGIGDPDRIPAWAHRFSLLSEPHRLTVLLAVRHAGPIAVTDLATATGISDTAVSQILRLLRASGTVTADRDGRVVRYRLADPHVAGLLDQLERTPVP
jgi:ArsR family transcriptional regulator, lead/cadmium/zinc/bismuth-responsive transcriptional repressor